MTGRARLGTMAYGIGCAILVAAATTVYALHAASGHPGLFDAWPVITLIAVCGSGLGWLLLVRRPDQRLGWVVAALGGTQAVQSFADAYGATCSRSPRARCSPRR